MIIGSHCVGLDLLAGMLVRAGVRAKSLYVGSMGGVAAARRGECDVAGVHLLDPATGRYNVHLVSEELTLLPGYGRMQGFVFRSGDARFEDRSLEQAVTGALADAECVMVNRNPGSGTRVLIDKLLGKARPPGYGVQTKSHNAVAAAVAQSRADWGIAIDTVARQYGLGFIALQEERFDFIVPTARLDRPAVRSFQALLADHAVRDRLSAAGFNVSPMSQGKS